MSCCKHEETENRIIRSNSSESNKHYGNNKVVNSKYNVFTFLPLIIWTHIRRFMNFYFILIGCLQLWEEVSPTNPITTWAPIVIIFAITFIREGIDDYGQHMQDKRFNQRPFRTIRDGQEVEIISEQLYPGDIIMLNRNQESPADIAVLYTSREDGKCCIETSNLDGETNLKERSAKPLTQNLGLEGLKTTNVVIECSAPNPEIYYFDSTIFLEKDGPSSAIAMNENQLIQAGTFLRNADFIYGMVCYNGNLTKLGKNSTKPPTKWTQIEKFLDKCIICLFVFQVLLPIIWGSIGNWKMDQMKTTAPYLRLDISAGTEKYILYFRTYLLTSILIPISFKVILDICKCVYATWIRNDITMYDFQRKIRPLVNNSSCIEDLGSIEYIFSDKTGTMTENEMRLKKVAVHKNFYGHSEKAEDIFEDESFTQLFQLNGLSEKGQPLPKQPDGKPSILDEEAVLQYGWTRQLVLNLALCHSLKQILEEDAPNGFIYEGQSPEEVCFLEGLNRLGFQINITEHTIEIESQSLEFSKKTFEKLGVLPFTFNRKRMSVIVRDQDTNQIYLYSKGAHEVITNFCTEKYEEFVPQVDSFSSLGLRVMAMAYKEISETEYDDFKSRLHTAQQNIQNREEMENQIYTEFEGNLRLIGCAGIEDRLQDDVPQTIEMLREAGIHVWMVTGDLMNTSIKIARSTRLISNDGELIFLTNPNIEADPLELLNEVNEYAKPNRTFYLVLEGSSPLTEQFLGPLKKEFAETASKAKCVICARTTPKQKARYVEAIQSLGKVTLAIGDGGNDVTMIRTAHIGIGIIGKEGRQASIASDFAINRFNSLPKLLLIHGRLSYYRTSWLTQFCFYKSIIIALIQIGYLFWNGFSGAGLLNDFNLMCYNAIFTILPVIFFIFDKDIDETTVYLHPYLYKDSSLRGFCNPRTFFWWVIRAIYQAIIIIVFANYSFPIDSITDFDGSPMSLSEFQQIQFTSVILIVLITVTIDTKFYTSMNFVFIWGNWLIYLIFTLLANLVNNLSICRSIYSALWRTYSNPLHWIVVIMITSAATMPVLFIQALFANLLPSRTQRLRVQEIAAQSKFQPTYLVDIEKSQANGLQADYVHSEKQDPPTVWDKSHNLFTPMFKLCAAMASRSRTRNRIIEE